MSKSVRPGFQGIGYFEEVDATEFIEAARREGVVDLTEDEEDTQKRRLQEAELRESLDGQVKRAIQAGANFSDALNEIAGLLKTGKMDSKLAKGLKDVVARVDNAMILYDHEIRSK